MTQEELKECLHYDPITGIFTWIKKTGNRIKIGDKAGSPSNGYNIIRVNNRNERAHRLAWIYVYGKEPIDLIDHKDGDRMNNAIDNLREASNADNGQNRKKAPIHNRSTGILGVSIHKGSKKNPYMANIMINNKSIYLGMYPSAELAHVAYLNKKREIHQFCTI